MSEELTDKQLAWIESYLISWDATAAARKAGYADPAQSGYDNKIRLDIQAIIRGRLAEKALEADEVLARLGDQARGSLEDFLSIGPKGQVKVDLAKAQRAGKLHLLHRYSKGKGGSVVIELYDAQAALQLLGKHLGLFPTEVKHSGAIDYGEIPDLSLLSDEELDQYEALVRKCTVTDEPGTIDPA